MSSKFSSQLKRLETNVSLPDESWLNLKSLVERCLGNVTLATRLVNAFRNQVPEAIAALNEAVVSSQADLIQKLSHRLKGEAANIGASDLANAAGELELAAKNLDEDAASTRDAINGLVGCSKIFMERSNRVLELMCDSQSESQQTPLRDV